MGVLAPLFLAGLAALSLPLLFHLVRRTPRGRQEFSSLMFLSPTPPRLTRRSRLDQIFLLLLRLGALTLLALAFARPFLRESAMLSLSDLPRRRVAILIDTSASMRRADLWQQAVRQVERELDDLAPHDDVALFAFSDRLEMIAGFATDTEADGGARVDVVRSRLRELSRSWSAGDLGTALSTLASELDAAGDVQQSPAEPQIVVVSDFQKGSRIEALQAFEWPEKVRVVTRELKPAKTTNASVQLLVGDEESAHDAPRVRVANAADSSSDQFYVAWVSGDQKPAEDATAVYVPPGQSRVVKLPRPESSLLADRIVLSGDDHDFDNVYYVVPPRVQDVPILYAGDDAADEPQGLLYYLDLAAAGDPLRKASVEIVTGDSLPASLERSSEAQLLIASRILSAALNEALKQFVERGGTLLLVPASDEAAQSLPGFFDDLKLDEQGAKRSEGDFALLGEIDFRHPLFTPFANPRYSDFTKIHFWRHRAVSIAPGDGEDPKTNVVVRFDSGEPWLLERSLGKGRVLALTSGWNPDDSQLAVSSKFVPLVGNLLDLAYGSSRPLASVTVDEPVDLSGAKQSRVITLPDGRKIPIEADAPSFTRTNVPGIYHLSGDDDLLFAVNLAASESDTAPFPLEQLEQLGVRRSAAVTSSQRLSRIRQQRDTELEGRQKAWRWLLVGCFALLIGETLWASRATPEASP